MMKRREAYYTTGRFSHAGKNYHRNCGPTAITNAVYALSDREEPAEETYRTVARMGQRNLIYYNFDLLNYFGGTVDILSPYYLRKAMKRFRLNDVIVHPRKKIDHPAMMEALRKGHILYIQFRHNRRYGNHHALIYDIVDFGDRSCYKLADGWKATPVFVPVEDIGKGYYIEIERK